jgi:hypothetical protein
MERASIRHQAPIACELVMNTRAQYILQALKVAVRPQAQNVIGQCR